MEHMEHLVNQSPKKWSFSEIDTKGISESKLRGINKELLESALDISNATIWSEVASGIGVDPSLIILSDVKHINSGAQKDVFKVTVKAGTSTKDIAVLIPTKKSEAGNEGRIGEEEFDALQALKDSGVVPKLYTENPIYINGKLVIFEEFLEGGKELYDYALEKAGYIDPSKMDLKKMGHSELWELRAKNEDAEELASEIEKTQFAGDFGELVGKAWKATSKTENGKLVGLVPSDLDAGNIMVIEEKGKRYLKFVECGASTYYRKLKDILDNFNSNYEIYNENSFPQFLNKVWPYLGDEPTAAKLLKNTMKQIEDKKAAEIIESFLLKKGIEIKGGETMEDVINVLESRGVSRNDAVRFCSAPINTPIGDFIRAITTSQKATDDRFEILMMLEKHVGVNSVIDAYKKGIDMSDASWNDIFDNYYSRRQPELPKKYLKYKFVIRNGLFNTSDPLGKVLKTAVEIVPISDSINLERLIFEIPEIQKAIATLRKDNVDDGMILSFLFNSKTVDAFNRVWEH